jgi:hypothetical protein
MCVRIAVVPPRAIAHLVNQLADLHAWGRAEGGWWGLVTWTVRGWGEDGILGDVTCSAWIPASELQPSRSATELPGYAALVRLEMPAEGEWPALVARPNQSWYHYGRLDAPPRPVPGLRVVGPQHGGAGQAWPRPADSSAAS